MKRTPLSIGSTIQAKGGSSYTYIIDRVIGDGASSIVYEAHYIDSAYGRHDVRLKECYPYASDIQRIGTELVWVDTEAATNDKTAFITAYHKLLDFQNTTKLRNSTTHIFDLCEANGTLYSVMDVNEGQTFEQDNSGKLSDILKTTLALARVVEKYHNNGYLHLDIKPSNFLVIPETRELVILFDVDSVTSMEDIASGKVKCVSYSKGWAAPEQMQGRIDKLCPATDIYSIGAILFQKVMGRAVENEDIGIFADWDFDGEMFEKVNPKIKRLLSNIFRKTLAANIKRRYQSVDSLISALETSVECVRDCVPYLISDCPNPNKNFLGREKELADIANAFNNGKKTIFLHGFGGIGKSELAKKYAELHEKEYDSILFLSYEDSLEDMLDGIQIQNCDAESKNDNIKTLKKIFADQRVLLIVDNFDVEIDSDDYLDTFLRLKVDKLFTSRTDFADIADDKTQQISIANLNSKELVSLFEKESALAFSDEDRTVIDEMLKTFNYYTLIVPILAKQLISSGWSLETLREKSKQGLRAFEDTEKVAVAKDGRIYRKTGLDMMRATFRMVGLTDIQRRVLTNLYFLRFVKINKEEYRKYLWKENEKRAGHIDAINDLLYLGWIRKKNTWQNVSDAELDIHPIIVEMIEIELEPDITTSDIAAYVQYYLPWTELGAHLIEGIDDWGPLYQDTIAHKLNWFCLFGASLDLTNEINLTYVVDTFSKLINGNIFIIQLIDRWILNKFLNQITPFMLKEGTSSETQFKISNILEVKWLEESIPRIGLKDDEEKEIEENVRVYFFKTQGLLDKLSNEFNADAIVLLCKPVVQLLSQYHIYHTIPKDIYDVVCSFEEIWDTILEDSLYTIWESNYESNCDENESGSDSESYKETNSAIEKEDNREYIYFKKFRSEYPVENVVAELLQDNKMSLQEKSNVFDDILSELIFRRIEFFRLYGDSNASYEHNEILKKTAWVQIEMLSSKYLDLCCEISDNDFSITEAELYIAIAKAMQGDFDNLINRFIDITDNTIDLINDLDVCDANAWKSITQFWDISDIFKRGGFSYFHLHGIGYYANIFRNLMLSHLALPILIKCVSSLEEKVDRHNKEISRLISSVWSSNPTDGDGILKYDVGDSEDPKGLLYNWYRTISEFALNSSIEKGIHTRDGMRYFDTYTEYLEKASALVSTKSGVNTEDIPFFHCYCQYETVSDLCVEYYTQCYFDGMDVNDLNEKILRDKRLTERGIMSIYEKVAREVFFEVDRCWTVKGGFSAVMQYLKTYDWSRLEAFLDFQEEYYLEKDDFSDDSVEVYRLNSRCDAYRAMLYAIMDKKEEFDECMEYLWEDFESDFKKSREYLHWSYFTDFDDVGRLSHGWNLTYAFAGLRDIEKHQFALPYLIKCAEHIHDWFKTLPNYSELMMYSWYKVIAEFALESKGYNGAYAKYQDKVDEMSEMHYEINFDNLD